MTARLELTRIPLVKRALTSRWLQWTLVALTLPFFILAILAGLVGTPAGNRNFGIVFVWIVWWALLILLLIPFAGRAWCAMCPIPAPGEWLQRRALVNVRPGSNLYTLGLKWHPRLKNIWLQNGAFLAVALFSTVILTTPFASAVVLLAFFGIALLTSVLFERRTFCRYLCPVGGFIGLYSQVAPVEVRVKDHDVCVSHREKSCYIGNGRGYGCPWMVFPAALDKNTYCGMCTECLKTCPKDNIGLYVRPFGQDLLTTKGRRLDEAYKALIMLTCALAYSAVLIGPWSFLKETAYSVGSLTWMTYALGFLAANLLLIPSAFLACAWVTRQWSFKKFSLRKTFVEYAYSLVPLGLAAWVAFSLSFVLINLSYAWQVLSDPFGWGWNLFGTANWSWTPYLSGLVPYLQIPVLLIGLVAAIGIALRTAREQNVSPRAALPIATFCAVCTMGLLWLYL